MLPVVIIPTSHKQSTISKDLRFSKEGAWCKTDQKHTSFGMNEMRVSEWPNLWVVSFFDKVGSMTLGSCYEDQHEWDPDRECGKLDQEACEELFHTHGFIMPRAIRNVSDV